MSLMKIQLKTLQIKKGKRFLFGTLLFNENTVIRHVKFQSPICKTGFLQAKKVNPGLWPGISRQKAVKAGRGPVAETRRARTLKICTS